MESLKKCLLSLL